MIKKLALAAVCAIGLASPAYAASIQIDGAHAIMDKEDNRVVLVLQSPTLQK